MINNISKNKANNQNQFQQTIDSQAFTNNSFNDRNNSNSSNIHNNNHNKKKQKSNYLRKQQNFNRNSYYKPNSNYDKNQQGLQHYGRSAINLNMNMGVPYNGNCETNLIHNPKINLGNYNTLLSNNPGLMHSQINPRFLAKNQFFLNYFKINQNFNGQQIPFTLNIPSNQAVSASFPVNIQNNGSYLFNFFPAGNNNNINQQYQKANSNVRNINFFHPLNGKTFISAIIKF